MKPRHTYPLSHVCFCLPFNRVCSLAHRQKNRDTVTHYLISISDVDKQKKIVSGFCSASKVKFDCCAGAIYGILIWMHKPSLKEADAAGVGQKKFFCGQKNKFGLNCQAVCDVRGRILNISITYGGSLSDCLAFEASSLHKRLEDGLLADGLVIFGNNAYLNTKYMATPYPNIAGSDQDWSRDNYNFSHLQVSC